MIIKRTKDLQEVMKCIPFETEIRKRGRDKTRLQKMLISIAAQLESPYFGFWIAYESEEDDTVLGYCIAFINLVPGVEGQYIYRMYARTKEVRQEFEALLKKWGKENKVKKQLITVSKNIKAFQRRHGFMAVSVNMERRL
jgi:hypothetical protein